jgi:hypothetical protein
MFMIYKNATVDVRPFYSKQTQDWQAVCTRIRSDQWSSLRNTSSSWALHATESARWALSVHHKGKPPW